MVIFLSLDTSLMIKYYSVMGTREREIINARLSSLAPNERLFRINAGMGWAGTCARKGDILIIKNPWPLHAAPEGWPDLCGWTSVTVTPDMVGQKIAVFTAEEVKADGSKLRKRQAAFREIIERMGGIFRIL